MKKNSKSLTKSSLVCSLRHGFLSSNCNSHLIFWLIIRPTTMTSSAVSSLRVTSCWQLYAFSACLKTTSTEKATLLTGRKKDLPPRRPPKRKHQLAKLKRRRIRRWRGWRKSVAWIKRLIRMLSRPTLTSPFSRNVLRDFYNVMDKWDPMWGKLFSKI